MSTSLLKFIQPNFLKHSEFNFNFQHFENMIFKIRMSQWKLNGSRINNWFRMTWELGDAMSRDCKIISIDEA